MVRIPGPEQVGRASLDRLRTPPVRADAKDFGADIGSALEGFGASVVEMGELLLERRQKAEDAAFINKGLSDGDERLGGLNRPEPEGPPAEDSVPGENPRPGDHKDGVPPPPVDAKDFLKRSSVVIDEIIASLQKQGMRPTQEAINQLRQQLQLKSGVVAARAAYEDHQARGTRYVDGLNVSLGKLNAQARNSLEDLPRLLEEGTSAVQRSSAFLDEAALASKMAMMGAGIVTAGYIGLIERDPERAAKSLENGEFGEFLPERTTKQLLDFAKKGAEQQKIVSRNAAEIGWQDWITRLLKGEEDPPVPDDPPSATLDDRTRNARAAQEEAARKHAFTLKAWRFVPSDDVRRELASLKPKRGSKGFANESFVFKKLEEVTNDMLAERAKDPAEFAMGNPRVREAFETAGDDPSRRSQAVALNLSLQEALGIAEADRRVLTNAEVNGFIAQYGVAEMDGRAGLLMDLKETHGEHFGRAVSELAKGGLDSRFSVLTRVKDEPQRFRFAAEVLAVGSVALKKHTGVSAAEAKAIDEELAAVAPGLRDRPNGDDLHAAVHDLAVHYYAQKGEAKASVSQALEMLGLPASKARGAERGRTATRGLQPAVFRVEDEADAADGPNALTDGVTRASFPISGEGEGFEDETEGGLDDPLQLAQAGNEETAEDDPLTERYAKTGGPDDMGSVRFFRDHLDAGEDELWEAAERHGFDPERVLLFRDMVKGNLSEDELREELNRLYLPTTAKRLFKETHRVRTHIKDPKRATELIRSVLRETRAGREDEEGFNEAVAGGTLVGAAAIAPRKQTSRGTLAAELPTKRIQLYNNKLYPNLRREERRWRRKNARALREKQARGEVIESSESFGWTHLQHSHVYRGKEVRTNGLSGKKRRYFTYDDTTAHASTRNKGEIEVYDRFGKHMGAIDPINHRWIKGPEPGRDIPIRKGAIEIDGATPV